MNLPDPAAVLPIEGVPSIAYLAPLADGLNNATAGEYSYAHDPIAPERFFQDRVRHHYDHIGDRLEIGRFCAFAEGAVIVMAGANHLADGFSTYPFEIFPGWNAEADQNRWAETARGNTVIGHDVWIGVEAMILPGVKIGSGAVIGTRAVVASDVAPFTVVAGNPARPVRQRFSDDVVDRLLQIAWWDWPVDRIRRNLSAIRGAELDVLEAA